MNTNLITLNPSAVTRALTLAACVLVAASVAGQVATYFAGHASCYGLVPFFYLDGEQNAPTAFSVLLLLAASGLLAAVGLLENQHHARGVVYWSILSAGFLYMSADEAWSIHESLILPLRHLFGKESASIFHFAWVGPAIVLVLLLLLVFWRFLMRLPRNTRLRFLIAACIYLEGAVILNLIGGYYAETTGEDNFTYSMLATVEESLEMGGMILFIRALLIHISEQYKIVRFKVDRRS